MNKIFEKIKNFNMRFGHLKNVFSWQNIFCFIVVAVISFFAVNGIAKSVALYSTNTIANGESIFNASEAALKESKIVGADDIWKLSEEFSQLTATHKEKTNIKKDPKQTGFYCIAEDRAELCVYNIDPNNICGQSYNLRDFDYFWVDSSRGSFYTVINISGRVVDLSGYYVLVRDSSANLASRLLINCYEAEEVVLKNTILTGTIVAPNANITYEDTVVNGQVYAKSSSGSRAKYIEVAFSGYTKIMASATQIEFKNDIVRVAAVRYLKNKYPLIYGDFDDSYMPGEADVLRVKSLNLKSTTTLDIGSDILHFKNLETLNCTYVAETSPNIDLSSLTKLTEINFSGTTIKNLTLGELPALLKLSVYNTKLTELDITGCPELVSLNYGGTDIKKVKYQEKTKIIYLNCENTKLTGFSKETVTALSELLYLDAKNNATLKSIDLSVFPKLKKVDITSCGLTDIDFSKCGNLYYVRCSNNGFVEIDISNAPAIIYFEAYSGVLEKIDATGLYDRGMVALYCSDFVEVIGRPAELAPKPSATATPSVTPTAKPSASAEPSATVKPSDSSKPSVSATESPKPTETESSKPTDEAEETAEPTVSPTEETTESPSSEPSETPVETESESPESTPGNTEETETPLETPEETSSDDTGGEIDG